MKNKQRTMNDEQRTYSAFTLIELVVAVALLALVFVFAGAIFNASIDSYRTACANAEIIQKLRAITDQLNADFAGIRTDAPLLIWFKEGSPTDPNRYDEIMFFADGDFQSTQLYDTATTKEPSKTGDTPVTGSVARIFYGQAQSSDPRDGSVKDPNNLLRKDRLLAKRQHILTDDSTDFVVWPRADMSDFNDVTDANKKNERYEHDSNSLSQWEVVGGNAYDTTTNNSIISTCFHYRPYIDKGDPNTFHKLMCEGVGSFAIQWAYWDSTDGKVYWFPSRDPDGNGSDTDSHFTLISDAFGVYFNIPAPPITDPDWKIVEKRPYRSGSNFPAGFYPKAFKFIFTLYDSRGVFKNGRTFTHIVYIGN